MGKVILLNSNYEKDYNQFLKNCSEAMLFHTLEYKELLIDFLNCKYFCLIYLENNEIVGAIPAMLKENSKYGNVINSLPFFGSYGGFLVHPKVVDKSIIKRELFLAFNKLAAEHNCILSTIISSPYDQDVSFYSTNIDAVFKDERIAQITGLPEHSDTDIDSFMMNFTTRCRRSIRKAERNGVKVFASKKPEDLKTFYEIHKENIESLGGVVKDYSFFEKVFTLFPDDNNDPHAKLMCASINDEVVAGLLLFYYKDTVEYFTPSVKKEFRNDQPLSLAIYQSMIDAVRDGYKYWNFEGTWLTQKGVYDFKKSWGAKDYHYFYYVQQYKNHKLLELSKEELLQEYPWFYLFPFDALIKREQ